MANDVCQLIEAQGTISQANEGFYFFINKKTKAQKKYIITQKEMINIKHLKSHQLDTEILVKNQKTILVFKKIKHLVRNLRDKDNYKILSEQKCPLTL